MPPPNPYAFPCDPEPSEAREARHVHFSDTYHPSSLSLRLTLGPRDNPTMVVRISIHFESGRMPRIKIRTKKPKEKKGRRGRRDDKDLR